ncbi:hypothetical protein CPB86DRAFT_782838 [Serendipita vermifera]|nr:hypothetical protein CPB86DRAFT_782838 [Serendipita vermifera]
MSATKQGLRVLVLPLTLPRSLPLNASLTKTSTTATSPSAPSEANSGQRKAPFVYYHVQSPPEPPSKNPHLLKRTMDKAVTTWASWGKEDKSSWKYKLYAWGERVADRVEFEETALKSVNTHFKPSIMSTASASVQREVPKQAGVHTEKEREEYNLGPVEQKAQFLYPKMMKDVFKEDALEMWKAHLTERIPYHKRYFYLWLLGLPITAPIGIAPIIPNVPFYFCGWRAWSHWKALGATTYLNQLVTLQYFQPSNDPTLDSIYNRSLVSMTGNTASTGSPNLSVSEDVSLNKSTTTTPATKDTSTDDIESQLLLRPDDVPEIVAKFELQPSVGAELLRAIEQVKMRLKKEAKQGNS